MDVVLAAVAAAAVAVVAVAAVLAVIAVEVVAVVPLNPFHKDSRDCFTQSWLQAQAFHPILRQLSQRLPFLHLSPS